MLSCGLGSQRRHRRGTMPYICFFAVIIWQHCQYYLPCLEEKRCYYEIILNKALLSHLLRKHHKLIQQAFRTIPLFGFLFFLLLLPTWACKSSMMWWAENTRLAVRTKEVLTTTKAVVFLAAQWFFVLWVRVKHSTAALSNCLTRMRSCKGGHLVKGQQKQSNKVCVCTGGKHLMCWWYM